MQDDFRWMPAAMFDMATTCRKEGMAEACNLLTESAILLHVFLAQKHGQPQTRMSIWDQEDDFAFPDEGDAPVQQLNIRTADVCVLHPRTVAPQNSSVAG